MRILFLFQIFDYKKSTIYLDLVKELQERGHMVTVIAGTSDMTLPDGIVDYDGIKTVYMKLPDQFGAGSVKKALIQMSIPSRMKQIMKCELKDDRFDVIAYPTPPVTLAPVLGYIKKKKRCAVTYLMLKDIFPQNAVDLGMIGKDSFIHSYYRKMEKKLYAHSDRIGCMSEANIEYLKKSDPEIPDKKLEYFPNTVAIKPFETTSDAASGENLEIMFGGNMGRPQDIEGLLKAIDSCSEDSELSDVHFSFVGDGSESGKIEDFVKDKKPSNFSYSHALSREEYEKLLAKADLGMISLAKEFTIPNFPSRLLSYMQVGKPVLAVVDDATDIDTCITEDACCGYACRAGDISSFKKTLKDILAERDILKEKGLSGRRYLERYFAVSVSADILERAYRG